MNDSPLTALNKCPLCSTPVEGERIAGLWTGAITKGDKTIGAGGPVYFATCGKCGADLEASLTKEDVEERHFIWSEREGRTERLEEQRNRKAELEPLLRNHETRAEVTKSLTLNFTDYSEGSERRQQLQKWLFLAEVAEAHAKYPGILLHVSKHTMTWLFFDGEEKLQGYFVRSS